MTNQEKKAYLMRYREADAEINDLLAEKETIMTRLTKMTSSVSGMPGGGGETDKLTNGVYKIIELDKQIDAKVDALVDFRTEIMEHINRVMNYKYRRLLKLRYIDCMTWEKISVEMNYCYMQVCRMHGAALNEIVL